MTRRGPGALIAGVSNLALLALVVTPETARASDDPAPQAAAVASQRAARPVIMSVPLVWNGQVLGDVTIEVAPDASVAIESQSLRTELGRLLTETGLRELDEAIAGNPFVSPQALRAAGFDLEFVLSLLQLSVNAIDPTLRPVEPLGGRGQASEPLLPSMTPAGFSAYLNTNVNLLYRDPDGVVAPDVFLFGAARYRGVVVEFDGGFAEDIDDRYRFYRRAARAVYDEPDSYRRWSAGDLQLENTGTLRTPFIGGIAVEKSRRTFDPFTSAVNLGRELLLVTPSTVEVIVNGAPYQTLDLQPGTYSLDDLPIQIGSNDVQLVIRDASGREQITRFDYFFDPIELEPGEEEYTAALGVIATDVNLQPDYSDDPVFIGSYRRALNHTLIVGGGVQISKDLQVFSVETQFVPQAIPGSFDFLGAVSTGEGTGIALRAGYRLIMGAGRSAKRLTATVNYESSRFHTVGDLSDFRLEYLSANVSYAQSIGNRSTLVAGANYFYRSTGRDQSTFFVDVNHNIRDNVRATVGVEYGTGSVFGSDFGVRAGISVLFGGQHRGDVTYQSRRELARASLSRGTGNHIGSVGYSVNVQDSAGNTSVDGVVDYIANRFEARASLASAGNSLGGIADNQTARLQIGTSLALADGAFGIGRPIQNSFLLAHPHGTLDGEVIAGRSLSDGRYEAASGPFGAAVVSRLPSYNSQDVQYDIDSLEAGYDIGAGVVRLTPPYRSGYQLLVGTERYVSTVGFLQIDGMPAGLVAGMITSEDDEGFEPEPFFTNSAGRFGIIGLAPGRSYTVRLHGSDLSFTVEVPENNTGLYRAGTIDLRAESQ